MKLAVVAGGWHWPDHFFRVLSHAALTAAAEVDLFVIGHRSPELPIVSMEKAELRDVIDASGFPPALVKGGALWNLDRMLYRMIPTIAGLQFYGWDYEERENTVGDWGFFNQWLERHDPAEYDLILNCHDDTFIRRTDLFEFMASIAEHDRETLLWANGTYEGAPTCYVRGSFEIWRPELIRMMGGKIDLGTPAFTREGATASPLALEDLMPWNALSEPTRKWMADQGLEKRIKYLSPYYRISQWAIEGERGFISRMDGAPWSYTAGLKAMGITE